MKKEWNGIEDMIIITSVIHLPATFVTLNYLITLLPTTEMQDLQISTNFLEVDMERQRWIARETGREGERERVREKEKERGMKR